MRSRAGVFAVVLLFASAVLAVAVVARSHDGRSLPRLHLGGVAPVRAGAASLSMPAGVVEYRLAATLPDLPSSAPAYQLASGDPAAGRGRVARALGVAEADVTVDAVGGAWYLNSGDEPVGRTATVACAMPPCAPGSACIQVCPPGPEPIPEAQRPAGLPARDGAEGIGRRVLDRAGAPLADGRVTVEDAFAAWIVSVDPVVKGLPTAGWRWSVGVGPHGAVVSGNGWLAEPSELGRYPLLGPAVAFDRLARSSGAWTAYPPSGVATAIAPVSPPTPVVRTVTGVHLGLVHDRGLLAPAYVFEIDDGGEATVIAVGDQYVERSPGAPPEPRPVPLPARK